VRNLLNITAVMPSMQTLGSSNGILAKTQRIGRDGLRSDGTVGTMMTKSQLWSVDDGDLAIPM
jgi:hypothetical protein